MMADMSWTVESLFGPDPMDWDLGDAWHARSVVGDRGGVLYALALVLERSMATSYVESMLGGYFVVGLAAGGRVRVHAVWPRVALDARELATVEGRLSVVTGRSFDRGPPRCVAHDDCAEAEQLGIACWEREHARGMPRCVAHDDCAEVPALGKACYRAGRRRRRVASSRA